MPRTRTLAAPALAALVAAALAWTGASAPAGASTKKATPASVTIKDFAFKVSGTAKPGGTIKVTNSDGAPHTFSADTNAFDSGTIQPGKSATVKVGKAGTVKFHCNIHPSMKGTLTVK